MLRNPRVGLITSQDCLLHEPPNTPEKPERLTSIVTKLEQESLWDDLHHIKSVPSKQESLLTVHEEHYVARVKKAARSQGISIGYEGWIGPGSFKAALASASSAVTATRSVLAGKVDIGFSLARPPGHHAGREEAMGFCIFNNAALAVATALLDFSLERILVVDFDVHHGNGTQEIFYKRADVLYYSLHQHPAYPPGRLAYPEAVGANIGNGFNVNVLLPDGCRDSDYKYVITNTLEPIVQRYEPQFIVVSAGFDAHAADPLSRMKVTDVWYAWIAQYLLRLAKVYCGDRLAIILEGGYNHHLLPLCVYKFIEAFLYEYKTSPDQAYCKKHTEVAKSIAEVRYRHPCWYD